MPHGSPHRDKINTVLDEFDKGTLKSSSGQKVTDRAQALAIAMSEVRRLDRESSSPKKAASKTAPTSKSTLRRRRLT